MSIDLTATQPVKRDQLGLTLRERMWLARAALTTIVLSALAFPVLLLMLPDDTHAPVGAIETQLAARESTPIHAAPPVAPLPLPELQRPPVAVVAAPEPSTPAPAPAPAPVTPAAAPVQVIKASKRNVVVTRGKLAPRELASAPAVDLSRPQPLAPVRAAPAPEPEPEPAPVIKASPAPAEEPALKRPAFE